ncbi:MAG: two-component regulator propeller domain-containing protein [Acidobacteriota bacterium]
MIARRTVLILLAAVTLLPCDPGLAFDPNKPPTQYIRDVWQTENGLPQNSILHIAQTPDGYLWLATYEGLVRFDGLRFTVFDSENTPEITKNTVFAMHVARDGSLWFGTSGGGLVRHTGGRFTALGVAEGLSNGIVRALEESRDGSLWIATYGGGLNRLKDGKVSVLTSSDGIPSNFLLDVLEDRDGGVWVGTAGAGLALFTGGRWTTYTTAEGLAGMFVRRILEDRLGNVWVGTTSGLSCFSEGKLATYTRKHGLPGDAIFAIYEDLDGNLWIGTEGGGLALYNGGKFIPFSQRLPLSDNVVTALREDGEGSFWIGTENAGLNRWRVGKFTAYTSVEGVSGRTIRAVCESGDGGLWMGSSGGGVTSFKNGSFRSYTTGNGLPDDYVRSVCVDRKNDVWLGTRKGLCRLRGGKVTVYTTRDGLPDDNVRAVFEDRGGALWLGTRHGLCCMKDGKLTVYGTRDGLAHDDIATITQGSNGDLWFGTNGGGVSRLRDGRFTTFSTRDGLSSDVVYSIYCDAEGSVWIGTYGGGLSRIREGKIDTWTRRSGLFDNVAFQILEDARGQLWMSCNRGIYSVSKRALDDVAAGRTSSVRCVSFGKADGMRSSECNSGCPAGCRTRDGRLWFPTCNGVVAIDPEHLEEKEQPPPLVVEDLLVDGQHVDLGAENVVPPGSHSLEIRYTSPSFLAPERVKFKYRLDGFDRDWVDVGTRRAAYYTNLPPASYTFSVKACNNGGVWNETGASIGFTLLPFFYQTGWFIALCAAGTVSLGLSLHLLRVRSLRRRREELARQVDDALAKIKVLSGLLPICAWCKKVRDDQGYWSQIESYIKKHSEAEFTHGICPECARKLYEGAGYAAPPDTDTTSPSEHD